jgi:hypothetical protein
VLVELAVAEIDRRRVDLDIHGARLAGAVQRHDARRLVELAAPRRQAAHVVSLEARVGVGRIDVVRRRIGQAEPAASVAEAAATAAIRVRIFI